MASLKYHSTESINAVVKQMEKDLKALKKSRKGRSDAGQPRKKYDSNLPVAYKRYIQSANKRGIEFNLSVDEFNTIIAHPCVYCGASSSIGVDRIDSSDGYNIDNAQPCCSDCNLMKFKHNEEKFLRHVAKIFRFRGL